MKPTGYRRSVMFVLMFSGAFMARYAMAQQSALTGNLSIASFSCALFSQQRYLADFDTAIQSSGYLRKDGDSIEWHTLEPIDDRTIIGPDAQDLSPALSAMAPLLRSLLSGDWRQLEKLFSIELSSAEGQWQATLLPRQEALSERLDRLHLSGGETVDNLELYFSNKDRLSIQLQATDCSTLASKLWK